MKTSESIDQLAAALATAQGEFDPVKKNKINPHFKNHYADLSSIFEATRPALSKHGIAFTQAPYIYEGRATILTKLLHKSGQWIETELSLKLTQDTPQGAGSTITYAKRYSASSILGVDAEDDDDAEGAKDQKPKLSKPIPPFPLPDPTQIKLFNSKDPKHQEWLIKKLEERKISRDEWDGIADHFHGLAFTPKDFEKSVNFVLGQE